MMICIEPSWVVSQEIMESLPTFTCENIEEGTSNEKMAAKFPDQYGDRLPLIEKGTDYNANRINLFWFYFKWSNLDGDKEKFGENEIELCERVRAAMRPDFCDAIDKQADERSF